MGGAYQLWGWLTFSSVVFLLGASAPLPPLALQDLQPVVLLELQDGQSDFIPERRACPGTSKALATELHGPAYPQPYLPLTMAFPLPVSTFIHPLLHTVARKAVFKQSE